MPRRRSLKTEGARRVGGQRSAVSGQRSAIPPVADHAQLSAVSYQPFRLWRINPQSSIVNRQSSIVNRQSKRQASAVSGQRSAADFSPGPPAEEPRTSVRPVSLGRREQPPFDVRRGGRTLRRARTRRYMTGWKPVPQSRVRRLEAGTTKQGSPAGSRCHMGRTGVRTVRCGRVRAGVWWRGCRQARSGRCLRIRCRCNRGSRRRGRS